MTVPPADPPADRSSWLSQHGAATMASLLAERARDRGDAPFLLVGDPAVRYDYAGALDLARAGARVLAGLGVGRGQRFGVLLDNRAEFFACWFGAALLGAVMVPVNPESVADELAYVLRHAACRAVITTPERRDLVRAAAPGLPLVDTGEFAARAAGAGPVPPVAVDPLDPLAVLYTSGSTGRPKGVVVTHANYLHAGETVAAHLRMRPDDRWLVVLPLFHANAQYYCVASALVTGASAAVMPRFSASRWASQARDHGATLASLFAAPMRMILAQPPDAGDGRNSLRCTVFAQNLTPAQLAEFESRFATPLLQLYGMTETIAPPLVNPLYGARDNTTVGRPVLGAEIRVAGQRVEPGAVGELLVAGHPGTTLMSGYLDDPAATDAAVRDGWLHTGDIVRVTDDYFVAFADRAKHMIKRAGENIAAAEIERVLDEHPDVYESAVIGVPDPIRDEAIAAYVVPRPGADLDVADLNEHAAARLARYKLPGEYHVVGTLPRTAVGKIQKHRLRQG